MDNDVSEDDGSRLKSGGIDQMLSCPGPYSGRRGISPTLRTLSAASSERVRTYEAGIQPTSDPSLRTAAHHPDSSCLTIPRISFFRNERWSESEEEKSYRQITEQIRS